MTDEQILESYKKYCTRLEPADNLSMQDYNSIKELERFIKDGVINPEDVVKAFKKANESKFLRGEVNGFTANIKWLTNPANIDKVNSGKYDEHKKKKQTSIESHDYDFAQLEREIHQKNMAKLEKIRNDEDHQRWKEEEFYKKYPNLRPSEEEQ